MTPITGPSINPVPGQNQPSGQIGKTNESSDIAQLFNGCKCDNSKNSLPLEGNFSSLFSAADNVADLAAGKPGQPINSNSETSTLDRALDVTGKILDVGLRIADFII